MKQDVFKFKESVFACECEAAIEAGNWFMTWKRWTKQYLYFEISYAVADKYQHFWRIWFSGENIPTMKMRYLIYLATLHNIQDHNHNVATDFKFEQDFSVVTSLS